MNIRKILSSFLVAAALLSASAGAQTDVNPRTVDAPAITIIHATPAPTETPSLAPHAFVGIPFNGNGGQDRPNVVTLTVHHANGSIETRVAHNARVNAGASAIAQLIGSAAGLPFLYVALSTSAAAVLATDTTCPSEITTSGLARQAATFGSYTAPSSLGASASYTLTTTWTATAPATITKICSLTAITGGTLGFETLLGSSVALNSGDIAALTWTYNV